MRKIALFFFLLFFFTEITRAQDNFPPVFELKTDSVLSAVLPDQYWQILEDEGGKYNFNQVSTSPLREKFHYDSSRQINFHIPIYWFRFSVRNITNHPLKISFYETFKSISDWYITDANGKVIHKTGGLTTPWSMNDNLKFPAYFQFSPYFMPLVIDSGATLEILNRVYFDYFTQNFTFPKKLNIYFGSTEKGILQNSVVNESHYFNSVHDAFLFGFMLLAAIFNFFSYLIIREKTYLYFALYVFFLGFGRFNIDSEFYLVFLREHPGFYAYFNIFFWTFVDFFLTLFLLSLLNTKKYYPRWQRFILWFNILNTTLYLLHPFIDYSLRGTGSWGAGNLIIYFSSCILYLCLGITLFMHLKRKIFFDRRFLIAIIPSFVIWAVGLTLFNFVQFYQFWFHWRVGDFMLMVNREWHMIETVCLVWQVLCFSWLLFHWFVELKQQVVKNELEKEIERNQLIDGQRIELEKQVSRRTLELKQSLENLKSTQSQLIQSEKMASLGELSAGIAHEIQNPLNFVNNFSEVNTELIDELQAELKLGNAKEALSISGNIRDNEQRISHHGRRADAIVKGMLQHSQVSAGKMEPADLNGIADEYLRLAYHGLRAKDKEFKVLLKTDYDDTIGEINIISQDMGRVLLNLYNNAFYSVNERGKAETHDYDPTVSVTTRKLNGKVEICVGDNGCGVPQKIMDKIFQPFFTTKPTGLGTGLGLSISYDIIKGHGGELKVESVDGLGAKFIIQIPC
jgi:two-component system, NtrC family, sensor kinase